MKKSKDAYTKAGQKLPEVPWKALIQDFKALRKSKGISQVKLEELSGTSQLTVFNFENGRNTTIKTIQKWYDAMGEPFTVRIGNESAEVTKLRRVNADLLRQIEMLKAVHEKSHS
jgi:transcriptional regulator with XRE-family HTH domain